ITNVVKKFVNEGLDATIKLKRSVNSDNAQRKVDGRVEAKLLEVACGPVPEGHSRWTLRLLEAQMKIILDEPISREAIRRTLKKTNFDLTAATTGASQRKKTQNITNVVRKFVNEGLDATIKLKRSVNSDNAQRKVDGRVEAKLLEVACGPVPKGHSRWTLRLLEAQMKIILDEPISREAIRRTLKKTNFDLTAATTGASQRKKTQNHSLHGRCSGCL
ncbi:hypothetical protein NYF20_02280, partial [Lactobacillus delbrueckii]